MSDPRTVGLLLVAALWAATAVWLHLANLRLRREVVELTNLSTELHNTILRMANQMHGPKAVERVIRDARDRGNN